MIDNEPHVPPFTDSVSLLASTIDSAMDLLSTIIIFAAGWYISHVGSDTQFTFPTGKRKIEPISIIGTRLDLVVRIRLVLNMTSPLHLTVFSVFMQASFLQVMIESIQRLFQSDLGVAILPRLGMYESHRALFIRPLLADTRFGGVKKAYMLPGALFSSSPWCGCGAGPTRILPCAR